MKPAVTVRNFTLEASQELLRDEKGNCTQTWVARCLEFDIVVQGKSLDELRDKFITALTAHVAIAQECGLQPFECLPIGCAPREEISVVPSTTFSIAESAGRLGGELLDSFRIPKGRVTLQVA